MSVTAALFWGFLAACVVYYAVLLFVERKGVIHSHYEGEPCNPDCCTWSEFKKRQAAAVKAGH